MTAQRLFRVDPRLVHATMMNVWVPSTSAQILLIGNRELSMDHKKRAILEMSAMGLVDVRFTHESSVAASLQACSPDAVVIVLFSSIESALEASQSGLQIDRLNVGHVPEGPGRTEVHPAVYLGPRDFEVIDALQGLGVEVFVQPLPNDKATVVPRRSEAPEPEAPPEITRMVEALRVVNERGLHLRAAHVLAHAAAALPCSVMVAGDGPPVNAKSLLGLTTLAATCGTLLEVTVEGPDAAASMDKLRALFASGFEEGVDWVDDGAAAGPA